MPDAEDEPGKKHTERIGAYCMVLVIPCIIVLFLLFTREEEIFTRAIDQVKVMQHFDDQAKSTDGTRPDPTQWLIAAMETLRQKHGLPVQAPVEGISARQTYFFPASQPTFLLLEGGPDPDQDAVVKDTRALLKSEHPTTVSDFLEFWSAAAQVHTALLLSPIADGQSDEVYREHVGHGEPLTWKAFPPNAYSTAHYDDQGHLIESIELHFGVVEKEKLSGLGYPLDRHVDDKLQARAGLIAQVPTAVITLPTARVPLDVREILRGQGLDFGIDQRLDPALLFHDLSEALGPTEPRMSFAAAIAQLERLKERSSGDVEVAGIKIRQDQLRWFVLVALPLLLAVLALQQREYLRCERESSTWIGFHHNVLSRSLILIAVTLLPITIAVLACVDAPGWSTVTGGAIIVGVAVIVTVQFMRIWKRDDEPRPLAQAQPAPDPTQAKS